MTLLSVCFSWGDSLSPKHSGNEHAIGLRSFGSREYTLGPKTLISDVGKPYKKFHRYGNCPYLL